MQPPWWGLLFGLGLFSFAVSLAIAGWVYIQALRAADVTVRLRSAHSETRRIADQLAATLESEREAAERAHTEALLRERFVHAVTHDLRQSLSALRLHGSGFAKRSADPDLQDLTRILAEGLASADATIESVAQAAWLAEAGPADLCPVAVGPLLGRIVRESAPLAEEAGLSLRLVPTSRTVLAEPNALERALRNLVHNAIRHSQGRRVVVGARRRGARFALVVADDGCGIAGDAQARIFDRFFQGSSPTARVPGSVGLGLATVQQLAQRMGGKITLHSVAGRGARFALVLDAASPLRPASPAGRAIVTDDDPASRAALVAKLERLGWTAVPCDGPEATQAAGPADAFLLDFFLGGGVTALDVLDGFDAPARARTLVVSGHVPEPLAAKLRAAGAQVSRKPLSEDRLAAFLGGLEDRSEQPVVAGGGHGLHPV